MTGQRGPDLIIAGAHKCATTTLHALLAEHPDLSMSEPKEPHYLVRDACRDRLHMGVWDAAAYQACWSADDGGSRLRGEASVLYLAFAEEATSRMLGEFDRVPKVVISLRDPIDRALSSYLDVRLKNPQESAPTFTDAVRRELDRGPWRLDGTGSPTLRHLALGRYSPGVSVFLERLGRERLLFLEMRSIVRDPQAAVTAVHEFLEIPSRPLLGGQVARNVGGRVWRGGLIGAVARSRPAVAGRRLLATVSPRAHARLSAVATDRLTTPAEPIDAQVRAQLRELYAPDVQQLATLTGLDLSSWLPAN